MKHVEQYYVYFLFRGECLVYVGKGANTRVLDSHRERQTDRYEIVYRTNCEQQAYLMERCLIALIGMENLENQHPGGDGRYGGWTHTEDVRKVISEKQRKAHAERPLEVKVTLDRQKSEITKGRKQDPEHTRKVSEALSTPEAKAKLAEITREWHKANPGVAASKGKGWWSRLSKERQEELRERHRQAELNRQRTILLDSR